MEIQLHPATGRGTVRSVLLSRRNERALLALAGIWALLALSLLWTLPVMTLRWLRHGHRDDIARESQALRASEGRIVEAAASLHDRALAAGDRLTRIAFLYDVAPENWPAELNPETASSAPASPEATLSGMEGYMRGLERGHRILARTEEDDPTRPVRVPSILPLSAKLFAPSALFGPRVSPWTGETEFFPGLDIATSAGALVIAPGAGRVVFAGRVRPSAVGWLWKVGNVVVVDHGDGFATVYGHLARGEVRVGQQVERGDRIGAVGSSGWALVPQLHYELWRHRGGRWLPTDPLYAILDHRLDTAAASLERMRESRAPEPVEPLPGRR